MKTAFILVILVIFAIPAAAVTYQWVDDHGTVNFTEDLGSVPPKFRKKARVVGAEEVVAPPAARETKEQASPVQKPKGSGHPSEQPLAEKKDQKKTYGDKPAEAWKAEFTKINEEIKAEEDQLVQMRGRLSDIGKMSRGEYLSIQKTIRNSENRILDLRKKREALNEEANKAEVPADIRGQ